MALKRNEMNEEPKSTDKVYYEGIQDKEERI
jgi:hypothetical protein